MRKFKSLEQIQSSFKWNLELKLGNNLYSKFDMIFKLLHVIFFGASHMILKIKKLGVQIFKR